MNENTRLYKYLFNRDTMKDDDGRCVVDHRRHQHDEELKMYLDMMKSQSRIYPNFWDVCKTDGKRRRTTREEGFTIDMMTGEIIIKEPSEVLSPLLPSFINTSIKSSI